MTPTQRVALAIGISRAALRIAYAKKLGPGRPRDLVDVAELDELHGSP